MKVTFEAKTFAELLDQINEFIDRRVATQGYQATTKINSSDVSENANKNGVPTGEGVGPGPSGPDVFADNVPEAIAPVDKPVDKPVKKPVDKVAAMNKARAAKQAKADAKAATTPLPQEPVDDVKVEAAPLDVAEVARIRQKTIEDLQSAYANGFQKEVFELLSRFGNGAKSFRELPPDAFVPIRKAIDNGALQ